MEEPEASCLLWCFLSPGPPHLQPSRTDTTCFDIDTVQAQSSLQRKMGMKIPQSPFLLWAQGMHTLPKDLTIQWVLFCT